jgi:hypothetical protein
MSEEKYIYQEGDITFKSSQCGFCVFGSSEENDIGDTCIKFPEGKPEEIKKTLKRCPFLDINT